jgi:glycosyltransferase involved in cell wall biosynthesis
MRFSLVVATAGRTDEMNALLASLEHQSVSDFEVVIVDQNSDDRLVPIIREVDHCLKIRHYRMQEKGLSRARNLGLRFASGEIIAFPDDDCIYPPDALAFVDRKFAADRELAALSGPAVTQDGRRGSARWQAGAGPITIATVWTSVISFNLFVRTDVMRRVGPFDEELGIGARFGSGEETDLALRIIEAGGKAIFDPALKIIHPDKRLTVEATRRATAYGSGLGRVLRKHRAPVRIVLTFLARPLGGIVWACTTLRPRAGLYYWNTLRGRIAGYLATDKPRLITEQARAL